jgi:hypothetical protein
MCGFESLGNFWLPALKPEGILHAELSAYFSEA